MIGHDHPNKPANGEGLTGRFKQWTGAALGGGRPTIKKGMSNVSGAIRSGYGDAGRGKRDPGRVVRARPVLGERPFRRGQSRRRAQMVQPRRPEGPRRRHFASPRGRRADVGGRDRDGPARGPRLDHRALGPSGPDRSGACRLRGKSSIPLVKEFLEAVIVGADGCCG